MKYICTVQTVIYNKGEVHDFCQDVIDMDLLITREWFKPCKCVLPIYYYKLKYLFN